MIKDLAIRAVHPNVVTIYDLDGNSRAYDAAGVEVALDADAIATKVAELEVDKVWSDLRKKRNRLIAETDYFANTDVTMPDAIKTYRQALRDLPANTTDPANPSWPIKPSV